MCFDRGDLLIVGACHNSVILITCLSAKNSALRSWRHVGRRTIAPAFAEPISRIASESKIGLSMDGSFRRTCNVERYGDVSRPGLGELIGEIVIENALEMINE